MKIGAINESQSEIKYSEKGLQGCEILLPAADSVLNHVFVPVSNTGCSYSLTITILAADLTRKVN